jgi:hypothetical protein
MFTQVWIVAALLFLYFAFVFWRYSNMPLRSFRPRPPEDAGEGEAEPAAEGEPEKDLPEGFMEDWEGYLRAINETNKTRFRVAALAFLLAAVTALAGLFA